MTFSTEEYSGNLCPDSTASGVPLPKAHINLIKLCVGAGKVEDLALWQAARMQEAVKAGLAPVPRHVTRMWPKREAELLNGGSLYWVFKGFVLARQRVLELQEQIGADGIRRCAIVMDPEIVKTSPAPRRPFQGWRYLRAEDSPPDLPRSREAEEPIPEGLQRALADIGLL